MMIAMPKIMLQDKVVTLVIIILDKIMRMMKMFVEMKAIEECRDRAVC